MSDVLIICLQVNQYVCHQMHHTGEPSTMTWIVSITVDRRKAIDSPEVPVMNRHPWNQAKVSLHDRWPVVRGAGEGKVINLGVSKTQIQAVMPKD